MLDYHLHLWPHGEQAVEPTLEHLASYCEAAAAQGVSEVAVTEHLFRFRQADAVVGGFWRSDPDAELRADVARYWDEHQGADLDRYVEVAVAARDAGLPVVVGLEVDLYAGSMDRVAALLDGYPFDVLLGSVHWLGAWMFDDLDSPRAMGEWDRRSVEGVWRAYADALDEVAGSGACDVLAHPDLCKVTGRRPEVLDEWHARMAEIAASAGVAAEVSSAGWRKPAGEQYPALDLLSRFRAAGVPVTTASDAHRVGDVAHRSADLRRIVADAGYRELAAFRGRRRAAVPLDGHDPASVAAAAGPVR